MNQENQNKPKTFSVGDIVTWTSQAGGRSKTKTGKIVAIVDANVEVQYVASVVLGDRFNAGHLALTSRDHESYLVQVDRSKRLYWPLVKYLEKVEDELPVAMTIHEDGRIEIDAD